MGYIKNVKLVAYLTQAGRKYIASGQNKKIVIPYFALSDPDVNYLIASKDLVNTQNSNILPSNFVPDLTGDRKNCIYSIANGIEQRYTVEGGDCNTVGSYIGLDGEIGCTYTALTGNYPTVQFVRDIEGVNKVIYDYDISDNNVVSFLSNGLDVPIQLSIKPLGYESVDFFINYENILSSYVSLDNNENPINIDFIRNSDGIVYKRLNFSNLSVLQYGNIYNFNLTLNNPINSIIGKINQIQFSLYKYGFIAFDRGTLQDPVTYELIGGQGEISDKIRLAIYDGNGNKISNITDTTSVSMVLDLPNGVTGFLLNQGNINGLTLSNVNTSQDITISYDNVSLPKETPLRVRLLLNQNSNFKLGKPTSFNLKVKSKVLVKNDIYFNVPYDAISTNNGLTTTSNIVATDSEDNLIYRIDKEVFNHIEVTIFQYNKMLDFPDINFGIDLIIDSPNGFPSNDYSTTESYSIKQSGNIESIVNLVDRSVVDITRRNDETSFSRLRLNEFNDVINYKRFNVVDSNVPNSLGLSISYDIRGEIKEFGYGIYEHTLKLIDVVDLNVLNDSVTIRFIYNKPVEEEVVEEVPIVVNYELPNPYVVKINGLGLKNGQAVLTYSNGTQKSVVLRSVISKKDNTNYADITYWLIKEKTEIIDKRKTEIVGLTAFTKSS